MNKVCSPREGERFEPSKSRPCDACRQRKVRCINVDGGNGCALCKSRSEECTFMQGAPRKKRRDPGAGIRSVGEAQLSTTDNAHASSSHSISHVTNSGGQRLGSNETPVCASSLLPRTLGHMNRQSISYIGLTSENDPQLFIPNSLREHKSPTVTYRHVGHQWSTLEAIFAVNDDTPSEVAREIRSLDAIEAVVTPHGPALVDLYFRIVHPSYPILHKKVFLEKHGRTYRELTPIGLAAVYLLALGWWSYSPELGHLAKPDVKELDRLVRTMMLESLGRPKISDLQGSLILLQRPDFGSWPLIGQLVAMAQDLGLHDDCSDWILPDWEPGVRKRVAWALFAQDKWGAMIYGRPSHIDMRNWDAGPLRISDFPETSMDDDDEEGSVDVEKGRSIFVHFIALTEILADILDAFFTLKTVKNVMGASTADVLEKAKPLQVRLARWYSELPTQLSMQDSKDRKLSSSGYLHLAYFTAEITLHRAILRAYDHAILDAYTHHITRSAATSRLLSTIEFVKQLKPAHLQSFWHFASGQNLAIIGTFGGLLWSTSRTVQEREMYRVALAEYRWTLRISRTSAEFLGRAIAVLDASPVFAAPAVGVVPDRQREQEFMTGADTLENTLPEWLLSGTEMSGEQMLVADGEIDVSWSIHT